LPLHFRQTPPLHQMQDRLPVPPQKEHLAEPLQPLQVT